MELVGRAVGITDMGRTEAFAHVAQTQDFDSGERTALRPTQDYDTIETFLVRGGMNHRELLKSLLRRKSLVRGTFTLASGRQSNYYLDCKLTTLDPKGSVLVGHSILELLENQGIKADAIGGPSVGADPIVTVVAAVSYLEEKPLPAFLVREKPKAHGRQRQIEGLDLKPGMKVVIVDEVCTTGKSTLEAISAAEEAGLQVMAVISLVDREEGGSETLRKKYLYHPVFTAKELLEGSSEDESEHLQAAEDTGPSAAGRGRAT